MKVGRLRVAMTQTRRLNITRYTMWGRAKQKGDGCDTKHFVALNKF